MAQSLTRETSEDTDGLSAVPVYKKPRDIAVVVEFSATATTSNHIYLIQPSKKPSKPLFSNTFEMRSFTTIVASLLLATAQAAPAVESRQVIYGCYFNGDGISNQYVSVGHDVHVPGKSGKTWHLDCGTTSVPIIKDVYAKCTVDGKQPAGITGVDNANINCPIA